MTGTPATPSEPDPYLDLIKAVRLCHPCWDTLQKITFSAEAGAGQPWVPWRDNVFLKILRPQLLAAYTSAMSGDARAVARCDEVLDQTLPVEGARRSRYLGRQMMKAFPAPPAEKLWARYGALVAGGGTSCHLAMVLAVRAAAFHLPPPALLSAYIFLEARGGLAGTGVKAMMEMVEQCVSAGATATPQFKAA